LHLNPNLPKSFGIGEVAAGGRGSNENMRNIGKDVLVHTMRFSEITYNI
jgi:hypothetical protein